ncbi:MAG TPA: hypothetical protein IAB71_06780 [Candidatus Scatomonas pullistercoris]|uniref:Uncharacterized protein n=1 Tax=Candidatus Scatomonas pullistercoris TaxID=2840920 RepID=A0A9D1P3W9_9FIRM|nr:hypothetical protein [Mordavella massiliensis]HIV25475.1 hypothetical protein [Candidatus Scatomonas pullistercoris]
MKLEERLKGDYMANYMTFFPVGNGDMTLIQTKTNKYIMIDCNIRNAENDDTTYDCNEYLQDNLPIDDGQIYLDAFFLTHSDNDHCRGIRDYFNLCAPEDSDDDKIRIDELYVPAKLMMDETHYNDDADAIREEAQRRLDLLGTDEADTPGNRIKIVGYSKELKDYADAIVPAGETISDINGNTDYGAEIFVLRPVKKANDEEESDVNDCTASFKITFEINGGTYVAIIGGDLKCENWKEVIELNPDMTFDLLLAPHHCSWHAVSSEDTHTGKANSVIEEFLEKSKENAYVVSSSKVIKRDGDNPPSYRAKNVYIKHLKKQDRFKCTAEYPNADDPKPLIFKITGQGFSIKSIATATSQYNSFTQKSYGGE